MLKNLFLGFTRVHICLLGNIISSGLESEKQCNYSWLGYKSIYFFAFYSLGVIIQIVLQANLVSCLSGRESQCAHTPVSLICPMPSIETTGGFLESQYQFDHLNREFLEYRHSFSLFLHVCEPYWYRHVQTLTRGL